MSELEDLRRDVIELREWKAAIVSKCKASDGFDALEWTGDKEGWGFIHYFIGHLETRALMHDVAQVSGDSVLLPRKLTAENGAKAALIGEFSETVEIMDEDGEEHPMDVPVSWDTIKRIWVAAVAHFDASQPSPAATVETPCICSGLDRCVGEPDCRNPLQHSSAGSEPVGYQFRQRSGVGKGPQSSAPWCDWCFIERETYEKYQREPNKLAQVRPVFANEPQAAPDRQKVIDLIGYHFAALVSGNNQPHMSGDPRARLLPHVRRRFDDACETAADAILALSRPQSRSGKVCAYSDGCPPDGPVCHLCAHLQP